MASKFDPIKDTKLQIFLQCQEQGKQIYLKCMTSAKEQKLPSMGIDYLNCNHKQTMTIVSCTDKLKRHFGTTS
jgi:hypothetical protein